MPPSEFNQKVLFVDDEPNVLEALARQLRDRFVVDTAGGGEEALNMVRDRGPYAVVVSDKNMPVMDGVELLARVREMAPDTVRMMLTGYADLDTTVQAVNEGRIFTFLTKPCDYKILSRAISEGVQQYQRVLDARELHAVKKLKQALEAVVSGFTRLVEARDPYTAGHQKRVAQLAEALARKMGLDSEQVEGIRIAALIHDIGKNYVPAQFLNKPGRLSEMEMTVIRFHSLVGYEVLEPLHFDGHPIGEIVLQHHERMNGSGYPHGLSGNEILLEARIIAVADVVEAMSSHRPYRPAIGIEGALQEIAVNRGLLYDPGVVDTCLDLFGPGQWRFEEDDREES